MVAGFCGGVVNIFHFHRTKPLEWVGATVCGSLSANYLACEAAMYLGTKPAIPLAFVIGWLGLKWSARLIRNHFPGLLFEKEKAV